MELTKENYYDFEANVVYMSNSQYGDWLKCPYKAFAKYVEGKDVGDDKEIFVMGRFGHVITLEPHERDRFEALNEEELYKKPVKNKPLEYYKKTMNVIAASDAMLSHEFIVSELKKMPHRETIMTGCIHGVPFKIMLDAHGDFMFADLKFMATFEDNWSKELKMYVDWILQYSYQRQSAIYRNVSGIDNGVIFGATKQEIPDVRPYAFTDKAMLDDEIEAMKEPLKLIQEYKSGEEKPRRCKDCEYCRKTKIIKGYERYERAS